MAQIIFLHEIYESRKQKQIELDYYIQTGPKNSSISTTVLPVTGVSFNQFTGFLALTGDFTSGSYVIVPNYIFRRCFLKSINFSIEPWKPMLLNMEFDCYGSVAQLATLSSQLEQTLDTGIISPLRGMSIDLSDNLYGSIQEYESLNFGIEIERLPNFEIGQAYPTKVSVGKITKTLQINGISNWRWMVDYQPKNSIGSNTTCTMTMADGNSFSVAGVLNTQNVSVDNNGVAKGGLQIVEEMV